MKINDTLRIDSKDWVVTMLGETYASLERISNPKETKMIKISDYEKIR